ncbi:MAG: GntR family transcriptional regulator [Acetobacteraceae bacterium]|nr:GntR family transcriptional regulator [Acetobacteraceae bacterium]
MSSSPRRVTSSTQIYADLRHRIVTGALRPLQCLSETDLAAALGVSRTPVREALGKLEEERLVEIRPRFGTFVAPILPEAVFSSQFVREALECAAIEQAAARCTSAGRATLEDILAAQRGAEDEEAFFLADDALHRALMAMAGQAAAWGVVHAAKAVLDRVRYLSVQRPRKRQSILAEHRQIVACVTSGDAPGAVAAMRTHLRGVFVSIEQSLAAHPEFFAGDAQGPRPNRHRPRQLREAAPAVS